MNTEIKNGQVTYVGFDSKDNGKWIIDTTGDWTYVCFQKDEFTQTIFGYVVKQANGNYKAWHGFDKDSEEYFTNVEEGIEYVKSLWKE